MRFGPFDTELMFAWPSHVQGVARMRVGDAWETYARLSSALGDSAEMVDLRRAVATYLAHDPVRMSDYKVLELVANALSSGRLALRAAATPTSASSGGSGGAVPPASPPSSFPPNTNPPTVVTPFEVTHLAYESFIAPGAEDPPPAIEWAIHDPAARIDSGKLEVFRSNSENPSLSIWTRPLAAADLAHGEHQIEWAGFVGAHPHFPQQHVSVEFSPYIIRLTVSAGSEMRSLETSFRVVATALTLDLGSGDMLNRASDKSLLRTIAASWSAVTSPSLDLPVESDVYPISNSELDTNGAAGFQTYHDEHGDGPRVPLLASVHIRDSKGNGVLAPKAWGRRQVLWRFEYVDGNGGIPGAAGTFVRTSADYLVAECRPQGTACHEDRGGKRSSSGLAHFRTTSSDSFPQKAALVHPGGRFTGPAQQGAFAGRTGVLFGPAAQAGDGYVVKALFDAHEDLDVAAPSAALEATTGVMTVVRRVTIASLVKKRPSVPELPASSISSLAAYRSCFLSFEVPDSTYHLIGEQEYNAAVANAVQADFTGIARHLINPAVNQYLNGSWLVTVRSHDELKLYVGALPATHPYKVILGLWAANKSLYLFSCYALVFTQLWEKIALPLTSPKRGITVLLFDGFTNLDEDMHALAKTLPDPPSSIDPRVMGLAPAVPDRHRAVVSVQAANERLLAHELGHCFFLHHAPAKEPKDSGMGYQLFAKLHDSDDPHCVMNYAFDDHQLCGLCQLRIRGWDPRSLEPKAPLNQK